MEQVEITKGYDSLLDSVRYDLEKEKATFIIDNNGLMIVTEAKDKRCFHNYGDKFNWVISRAKHYSEKTGINWQDILKGWEEQRSYWYMNFYQDANQPEIKGSNVIIVKDREEFFNKFPSKKFICPHCKGITSNPNSCNSGKKLKLINGNGKEETCNWCSGGLFGTLGDGVYVFLKNDLKLIEIFRPLELEGADLKEKTNHA